MPHGALELQLGEFGAKTFNELKELTHRELAWRVAPLNSPMRFELMIDEDVDDRESLIERMAEIAPYAAFGCE